MTYRVYIKKDYKPAALRAKRRNSSLSLVFPFSIGFIALITAVVYFQPFSSDTQDIKKAEKMPPVIPAISSTFKEPELQKENLAADLTLDNSWATADEENNYDNSQYEVENFSIESHEDELAQLDEKNVFEEFIDDTDLVEEIEANDWQSVTVKKGDSLALIFSRLGLSANELYHIMKIGGDVSKLKKIQPGQILHFQIQENKLTGLEYDFSLTQTLSISKETEKFSATLIEHELDAIVKHARATINDSLFLAGKEAGLTDNLIMQLVA